MLATYENTLRRVISSVIPDEQFSSYKVSKEKFDDWKEKRDVQTKKNKGVSFERRLLYYSEFHDLREIIHRNWELFFTVLVDKQRFDIFFKEVESYRNSVAHGRLLTSGQEALLKGIVSDLKRLITIYHNKNEMKEDYFIRILKLNDNLGNIWETSMDINQPTLRVGDEYELTIEAFDPKDRKIKYELYVNGKDFTMTQDTNRFNFTIDKSLIGKMIQLSVGVGTPSSKYKNEAHKYIVLCVLPA